jgi:hypothetical protein
MYSSPFWLLLDQIEGYSRMMFRKKERLEFIAWSLFFRKGF